jgi:hypothetical protein
MQPMPFAAIQHAPSTPSTNLMRARLLGLALSIGSLLVPGLAAADTAAPSPPGHAQPVDDGSQGAAAAPQQAGAADQYEDTDPSALSDFGEVLDPHGTWVQDPNYGTLWVPSSAEVGADFAPYQSAGHWGVTDAGDWAWESDYDWGYVPFHYGRWVWAGAYWGWIPGRVYAPAWVTWRVGEGGYIGWAPLPPTWYWSSGVAVGLWSVPWAAYCFVPTSYVFYGNVSTYVVRDPGMVRHAAGTTRPYHPASPSAGHHAAGGRQYHPASPSMAAAHVPPSSVPKSHVSANTRAMSFATRGATTAMHRNAGASRSLGAGPATRGRDAWRANYDGWGRRQAPGGQTYDRSLAAGGQGRSPTLTPARERVPTGSFTGAPPSRMAPSHSPSFHAPAPSHFGGGSFHSASPSIRTPSHSVSRPSTVSRPHFGGGGHFGGRGGGGRRR